MSIVERGKEHLNFLLPQPARADLINHTLIFTTTYKCNLDCVYCPYKNDNDYGDFVGKEDTLIEVGMGDITLETLEQSIKEIEENSDRVFNNITIHGPGEPLLKWKVIVKLLERLEAGVKNIAEDATLTILTNGTLLGNANVFNAFLPYKNKMMFVINNSGFNEFQYSSCPKFKRYESNQENIKNNLRALHENTMFKIILTETYATNLLLAVHNIYQDYGTHHITINIDNTSPELFANEEIQHKFIANLIHAWKYCKENMIRLEWSFDCTRDTKTYAHPGSKIQFFMKNEYCDYNILSGKNIDDPNTIQRFKYRDDFYNNVCKDCIAFGKCVPCLFAVDHNEKDQSKINWNDCKTIVMIETILQGLEQEFQNRVLEKFKDDHEIQNCSIKNNE